MNFYGDDERRAETEALDRIDFERKTPLDVDIVREGIVVPPVAGGDAKTWLDKPSFGLGGVCDPAGKFYESSFMFAEHLTRQSGLCRNRFGGACDISGIKPVRASGEVVYAGLFWKQWGHFLIDIVGRLWYATRKNYKVVFALNKNGARADGNFLELLRLFGIPEERILYVTEPTQFDAVHTPETSFYSGRYYTDAYRELISRAIDNAERLCAGKKTHTHIFLSRKKTPGGDVGEENISSLMAENGYHVLYPEELSAAEQIYQIRHCDCLAGISGSAMHNAVFLRDGARQILFDKHRIPNPFQIQIGKMRRLRVDIIDAYREAFPPLGLKQKFWVGPYWIVRNRQVKTFCEENGYQFKKTAASKQVRDFAVYCKKYLRQSMRTA